jgi:prevent-host-death family protein
MTIKRRISPSFGVDMGHYNIHEAKAQLSALVKKAMAGEEVIIARDNRPVAKLTAINLAGKTRKPGSAKGQVWIAPDFDAPLEDFKDYR